MANKIDEQQLQQLANAGLITISPLLGRAIDGGRTSVLGTGVSTIGNLAGQVTGDPLYSILGSGIGSGINRLAGSYVDQNHVNEINMNNLALNTFQSNAGDFDSLGQTISAAPTAMSFSKSFVGKGSPFNGKVSDLNYDLNQEQNKGVMRVNNSIMNNFKKLNNNQMLTALTNTRAKGGPVNTHGGTFTNGVTMLNNGGTHEENIYGGVKVGEDQNGVPNLLEGGEVLWNDFVFSNRIPATTEMKQMAGVNAKYDMTVAELAKVIQKESEERPNDPISARGLNAQLGTLAQMQEEYKAQMQQLQQMQQQQMLAQMQPLQELANQNMNQENYNMNYDMNPNRYPNITALGGRLFYPGGYISEYDSPDNEEGRKFSFPVTDVYSFRDYMEAPVVLPTAETVARSNDWQSYYNLLKEENDAIDDATKKKKKINLSALRYLPAIGSFTNWMTDLLGWTNKPDFSDARALAKLGHSVPMTSLPRVSTAAPYIPVNYGYPMAQAQNAYSATVSNLINSSNGNRGLLNANLIAAANNYNNNLGNIAYAADNANYERLSSVYDKMRNAEQANAQIAGTEQQLNTGRLGLRNDALSKSIVTIMNEKAAVNAAKQNNYNRFLTDAGNIGIDELNKSWITQLSKDGILKGDFLNVLQDAKNSGKSCGGAIKRKRKRGLTI